MQRVKNVQVGILVVIILVSVVLFFVGTTLFKAQSKAIYQAGGSDARLSTQKLNLNRYHFVAPKIWNFKYSRENGCIKFSNPDATASGYLYYEDVAYDKLKQDPKKVAENLTKKGIEIKETTTVKVNNQELIQLTGRKGDYQFDMYIREYDKGVLVAESTFETKSLYNSKSYTIKAVLTTVTVE